MHKGKTYRHLGLGLTRPLGLIVCFLMLPFHTLAQGPLALCTDWLATVDTATQQIRLSWRPSVDTVALGYYICTGSPCLDYNTVIGRLDTTFTCLDHSPLEEHTYRLQVYGPDSMASSLTPSFGNMVLQASVPECSTFITASWNPYVGMPGGVVGYRLLVRLEPYDSVYFIYYNSGPDGPFSYTFDISGGETRVNMMVEAYNAGHALVSHSNIVSVERHTIDTAAFVEISSIAYDTVNNAVRLRFHTDTSYHGADHHTLWRSIDGSPWRVIDNGNWQEYTDHDINRFDSLYCYQLSIYDACKLNEKFSATACTVVPDPPAPNVFIPNTIIAGDPDNGSFRPQVLSLNGDIYELAIYNRNGLLIFYTEDPSEAWTPTATTMQGAYTYTLRVRYTTGIIQSYVGTILVIK